MTVGTEHFIRHHGGAAAVIGVIAAVCAAVLVALGAEEAAAVIAVALCLAAVAFFDLDGTIRLVFAGYAALPFVAVVAVLQPDAFNYGLLFAGATGLVAIAASIRERRAYADVTLAYLAFVPISLVISSGNSGTSASLYLLAAPLGALALYYLVAGFAVSMAVPVKLLIGLMAIESLLGIAQSLAGVPVFRQVLPALMESNRGYLALIGLFRHVRQGSGTFDHFNSLGSLLALGMPLLFGLFLARRDLKSLALCVIVAGGVIATYSRGALLGSVIGCLLLFALEVPRSRRVVVMILLAAGIAAIGLGSEALHDYESTSGNLDLRAVTWRYALTKAGEDPSSVVLGFGYRHFQRDVLTTASGASLGGSLKRSLHSAPLQIFLELGLIGTALFALGVIRPLMVAFVRRRRDIVALSLASAVTGFLVMQVFDNGIFGYQGVLMFALLAVLVRCLHAPDDSLDALWSRRPSGRSAGATAGDPAPYATAPDPSSLG